MQPPLYDGTNYEEWKIRMRIFIKAIDERAWRSILTGWTPPTIKDVNGKEITKSEIDWTNDEMEIAGYNSKALDAIFSAVDDNQFRLIMNCTSAKEAWEILQVAYKENETVRRMKFHILHTRFDNLRTDENETISSFYAKLRDIANEAYALGEPYYCKELLLKVLRCLPERFDDKVPVIAGTRSIMSLKLEELIVWLQMFEIQMNSEQDE